jgi:hypothetical protein
MEICEPYFLNHKNITRFMEGRLKPKELTPVAKPVILSDRLFWCFFIIWKGDIEYEHIKLFKQIELTEKQLKIEFLEKINLHRKQLKIKNLASIEANLMEKEINYETLVALAHIEKLNIMILFDKSFFLTVNDISKPYYSIKNGQVDKMTLEEIDKITLDINKTT